VLLTRIQVDKDGKIQDAKFKTFGCGSAIASSSVATEWLKGRTIEECLTIKNTTIAAHLKLPPVKLHCRSALSNKAASVLAHDYCSMLAEDAIKAAVKDWQSKNAKQARTEAQA
jgi:nitrogen fixation NifU-like protein